MTDPAIYEAQGHERLRHARAVTALDGEAAKPTPFCLRALMGTKYSWDPRGYLAAHLRFERFAAACDRVVGLTPGLNGTSLRVGDSEKYLAAARPQRLPDLLAALRALDALIEEETATGRFTRGKAFAKERFQAAIQSLERR